MELDPQLFHVGHVAVDEFQEYEGCEKCVHDLKLLFLNTLFEWKNASGLFLFAILPEMLGSSTFSYFCIHPVYIGGVPFAFN